MSNKTCGECCHLEKAEHFSSQCKHCNGTVSTSNTACNHFSKRYGICPECGSYLFSYEHTEDNDWQLCICELCGCSGTPEEFLYNSVFARITSSLEALAEKFIFKEWHPIARCYVWYSLLLNGEERLIYAPAFDTKEEALTATVEKLKEVAVKDEG